MNRFFRDLAHAVGFLSRLPVPARHFTGHDGKLSRTVRAFPLAGLVIALPAAILAGLLAAFAADPLLVAALTVGCQVMLTGALHEDGLADTADGIGARRGREHALAIMEDSRTGVYGVVALCLTLLLRTAALAAILAVLPPLAAALVIVSAAMLSRAAMVLHWRLLPPAKTDGLAVSVGAPIRSAARFSTLSAILLAVPLSALAAGPVAALAGLVALTAAAALFSRRTEARLGGFTGDTIGATQQVGEVAFLAALALCL